MLSLHPADVNVCRWIHEEIVPGDIVLLNAGDVIPGDSLLLESNNLFVNEASLTGETFPVEKTTGVLPPGTPLSLRSNSLFTGTYAVSGTGKASRGSEKTTRSNQPPKAWRCRALAANAPA